MADIRATPVKYPALRFIAQALRGADQFARAPFGYTNPPVQIASDLLSVPELYRTLENVAYGSPLTRGTGQARVMTPDTKGAAMAALDIIPMAGPAARLAVRGGKAAAPYAARQALQLAEKYGVSPTMNVVKPKGGNWLAGNVENAIMPVRPVREEEAAIRILMRANAQRGNPITREQAVAMIQPPPLTTEDRAIDAWLNSKLDKYIRNELATPEDPLREMAGRGISHLPEDDLLRSADWVPDEVYENRRVGGFPEEGLTLQKHIRHGYDEADELAARRAAGWENLADSMVSPATVREIMSNDVDLRNLATDDLIEELNPWMKKVDPETKVNVMPYPETTSIDLGLDHLVDELRNSLNPASGLPAELIIDPAKLEKMTVPHIVEHVSKVNAWRDNQTKLKLLEDTLKANLHKDYPEQGYRWVQLNRPGQFKTEGDIMGHSVGGYEPDSDMPEYGLGGWEGISSGKAKVYSLRDKQGMPHVTIEVGRGLPTGERAMDYRQLSPEDYAAKYGDDSDLQPVIHQIKGKANRPPTDQYLPFVQDFVRSNKWSDVREAKNAGLRQEYDVFNPNEAQRIREAGGVFPEHGWLTGEDIQQLHNLIYPEGKRLTYDAKGNITGNEPNFAEGGSVMIDDLYDKYEDSDMAALQNMSDPMYYEERGVAPGQPQDFGSNQEALEWLKSKMQDEPGVEPIIDLGSLHSIKLASDPVQVPTVDQKYVAATTPLRSVAIKMAQKYNIPTDVFLALIKHESGFNQISKKTGDILKSSAGALGLSQLMPDTAKFLKVNPYDPVQNLEGGAKYLRMQLDKFKSLPLALAAYNAGPGNVAKHKGIPPFSATKQYVRNILSTAGLADSFKNSFPEVFGSATPAASARKAAARPVLKKAEGGSVSKYDPAEVMMLADQIREGGYV